MLHLSHRELLPSVRMAAGVILLSVTLLPIGSVISGIASLELPELPLSGTVSGGVSVTGEEAYLDGISAALSERFGVPKEDFTVSCRGFVLESLSAEKVYITASGRAALLDYRRIEDYIEENLEVGDCECEIKIG